MVIAAFIISVQVFLHYISSQEEEWSDWPGCTAATIYQVHLRIYLHFSAC